jgi:xanthine dehydrogenase YagS FAD-binding subunit
MNVLQTLPEFCAGGTDLSERRRSGISRGQIVDLIPTDTMTGIAWGPDGAARIGALVTIETLASDPRVRNAYPGFAAAAASLATPQIRSVGTLGGNLAQRSRCGYFRNPHLACLKKGDRICPARAGNHLYGVAFDLGPCVAPHPSTLAAALLAYDATVTTNERSGLTIGDLLGDGSDGAVDNTLKPGEHIIHVDIRAPRDGERAGYHRVISRTYAEWPLVEAIVRVVFAGQRFEFALHNRSCNSLPATPAFIPEKRARIVAERFLIPPFGGSNPPAQAARRVSWCSTTRCAPATTPCASN